MSASLVAPKAGRFYMTRSGKTVGPMIQTDRGFRAHNGFIDFTWWSNGSSARGTVNGSDLVKEVSAPAPEEPEAISTDASLKETLAALLRAKAEGYRAVYENGHRKKLDCSTVNGALEYGRAQGMELAATYVEDFFTATEKAVAMSDAAGIAWFEKRFGVPLGDKPGARDVEIVRLGVDGEKKLPIKPSDCWGCDGSGSYIQDGAPTDCPVCNYNPTETHKK